MSLKPGDVIKWALNATNETRQGGSNKVQPPVELEANGSLDGNLSLNHFNWMMNALGLWSQFLSDMAVTSDGAGVGLTKDDHFTFIVAADKTDLTKHIVAIAFKSGAGAATTHILQSATLAFGTPNINGTIAISGATSSNVVAFSLNLKIS